MRVSISRIAKSLGKKRMQFVEDIYIDNASALVIEVALKTGYVSDESYICVVDVTADKDTYQSMIHTFKHFLDGVEPYEIA